MHIIYYIIVLIIVLVVAGLLIHGNYIKWCVLKIKVYVRVDKLYCW